MRLCIANPSSFDLDAEVQIFYSPHFHNEKPTWLWWVFLYLFTLHNITNYHQLSPFITKYATCVQPPECMFIEESYFCSLYGQAAFQMHRYFQPPLTAVSCTAPTNWRCLSPTLFYKPITTNIQSVDVIAPFGCIR